MFDIEDRTLDFVKVYLEGKLTELELGFACPVHLEFDDNRDDDKVVFPCILLSVASCEDIIPSHGFYEVDVEILVQTDIIDDRDKVQHRKLLSVIREAMLENDAESIITDATANCTVSWIGDATTASREIDDGIRENALNYDITWSPVDE